MHFVYVPKTADMELTLLHKSINCRELVGADYEAMYTTALQRVFQVMQIQQMLGSGGVPAKPQQVHDYYEVNVKISSGEALSLTTSGPRFHVPC